MLANAKATVTLAVGQPAKISAEFMATLLLLDNPQRVEHREQKSGQ